jgi:hypothetical protein
MKREWVLELMPETPGARSLSLQVMVGDPQSRTKVRIISSCRNLAELQAEISVMKGELDGLVEEAREKIGSLQGESAESERTDPAEVWRKMEALATDEEMLEYFNSFSETERRRIAEYIFSHANMFKGRGPVFSERYDASSHVLE